MDGNIDHNYCRRYLVETNTKANNTKNERYMIIQAETAEEAECKAKQKLRYFGSEGFEKIISVSWIEELNVINIINHIPSLYNPF